MSLAESSQGPVAERWDPAQAGELSRLWAREGRARGLAPGWSTVSGGKRWEYRSQAGDEESAGRTPQTPSPSGQRVTAVHTEIREYLGLGRHGEEGWVGSERPGP